jgi:hypothetical protein
MHGQELTRAWPILDPPQKRKHVDTWLNLALKTCLGNVKNMSWHIMAPQKNNFNSEKVVAQFPSR